MSAKILLKISYPQECSRILWGKGKNAIQINTVKYIYIFFELRIKAKLNKNITFRHCISFIIFPC